VCYIFGGCITNDSGLTKKKTVSCRDGNIPCSENPLSDGLGLGFERHLLPKAFKAFDVVTRHSFRVQPPEAIVSSFLIDFHGFGSREPA